MRTIDLNADLGEGFPCDDALLQLVTSTSVCCGAHAGDPSGICRTLELAIQRQVRIGAHPGYPDRAGFGRVPLVLSRSEVTSLIVEQVESLIAFAQEKGGEVAFLKPHGALYNQAQREVEAAEGVLDAAEALGLPLLGMPGSLLEELAVCRGLSYLTEGFPDRRYLADGSLAPRTSSNATIYDPAEVRENVDRLLQRGVSTLCVHGDDERSVTQARLLVEMIQAAGWELRSLMPWD